MQQKYAFAFVAEVLGILFHLFFTSAATGNTKPNVIILIADDLSIGDLSCYGSRAVRTKNLDSLAEDGLKLNRMYSMSSDSGTMAALISGMYPVRKGLGKGSLGWSSFWSPAQSGGLSAQVPNIASLYASPSMKYQTAFMGRWDLGAGSHGEYLPGSIGFMSFYGTPMSHSPGCSSNTMFRFTDWDFFLLLLRQNQIVIASVALACILPRIFGVRREASLILLITIGSLSLLVLRMYCWMGPLSPSSCILYRDNEVTEQPYQDNKMTQRLTLEAVNYLKYRRSKTFFLMVSYLQPKYPAFSSEQFKNKSGISPYYDAVLEVDWSVGKILQTLEMEGISNETVVIFLSDNGPQFTDIFTGNQIHNSMVGQKVLHRDKQKITLKGEKGSSYEGGIHIPAMIRWPGHINAGMETDVVTSVLDIFPTVIDITNIKKKYQFKKFDGESLTSLFKNPKQKPTAIHSTLFHVCDLINPKSDWAVTAGDMKVHFVDCSLEKDCKSPKTPKIYNITADPGETVALSVKDHAGLLYNIQLEMAHSNLMIGTSGLDISKTSQFDKIPYPWNFPCTTSNFLFCHKELDYEENFNSLLP
ncbi:arylsulfatase A-like [Ylistrum balloti]|uniref:arylsulfatase A-like n=1 Tax=Ylistrum balloti TaxID=509963 RepID=UPI002905BBC6|nr:arylsulfatase A-like [Ylistrum balloti]